MRKLVSLLLALTLVFGLATTAFAAETTAVSGVNGNNGKITITNAVVNQTYTVYQILVLESFSDENDDTVQNDGAYSYKAAEDWTSFVSGTDVKDVYLKTDANGYVTWVEKADVVKFAELAKAYAKKLKTSQGSEKATTTTVEFTGLNLGYYLVDSTLGTLCSLDTTNPNVTMQEKNGVPTNEKEVQEDSDEKWYDHNDADIGQTVYFRSTITVQAGAENYVFHDKMSSGLTYTGVTGITLNGTQVEEGTHTIVSTGLVDGCTFHVIFTQDFCDKLKANDKIVISYTATLNENAVVGLPGNPNESKLSFGETNNTSTTTPSETKTYTWDMGVLKYGNGDESKVLSGAKFVLIKKTGTDENKKELVAVIANGKVKKWNDVPAAAEGTITWPEGSVLTTGDDGKIHVDGLDADTYYLREIAPPAGYNVKKDDTEFKVKPTTGSNNTLTYTTVETKVNNQSGTELPSTGGMGTTIFYILGSILVLAAGVLLVTKKRMSTEG